ncbi:MAG: bile acid:sodium symporter, partial [Candidatus Binatia bacterium]
LAVVIIAGVLFPEGGMSLRKSGVALPLLTAASLFISGLVLETAGLREGADTRGLLLGLSSIYVAAPFFAWILVRLFGPPNGGPGSEGYFFFEAMMIVAAQAGTIASAPALTLVAGGNQGLALLITISSNLLTAFVTPLVLRLTVGTVVSFPIGRMIMQDVMVVLVPVVLGLVAHSLVWGRIRHLMPVLVRVSQTIILVFVFTGVSAAASHLAVRPGLLATFVMTAAFLHLLLLAWNYEGAQRLRLSPASRTAVVICGSQKTLPNGIYLWDKFFPSNPHGALALVCFHVFQLVFDSLLVSRLKSEPARVAAAEAPQELIDGA